MSSNNLVKVQQLRESIASITEVMDSLGDEKERLSKMRRELSECWCSEAAEIFLSELDKRINEIDRCISKADGVRGKIKKQADLLAKSMK